MIYVVLPSAHIQTVTHCKFSSIFLLLMLTSSLTPRIPRKRGREREGEGGRGREREGGRKRKGRMEKD